MAHQKLIVITGASSGIGRELALTLAARGQKVLAIARNSERLQEVQRCAPSQIDILQADVGKEDDRIKIRNYLGNNTKISHLVHNAGILAPSGLLETIALEEWRKQIAVNVEAPLFLTKELLPFLHGGRMLSLTSSQNVNIELAAYGISKAALNMMMKYFQIELKKYNIAVSVALPGFVETNIQKQLPQDPSIPIKEKVDRLKKEKKFLSPQIAAAFLTWVLLDVDAKEFSERVWEIYDTSHHIFWAKNLKIPIPS